MAHSPLQAQLCNVRSLFASTSRYIVPIYQRNYAWRSEQIQQLIDDVYDAFQAAQTAATTQTSTTADPDSTSSYFLGNLIVTAQPAGAHISYELVDGQQRLTTLHMLLTALGASSTHQDSLQYASRPKASQALQRLTLADLRTPAAVDEDSAIVQGFAAIAQHLQSHPKMGQAAPTPSAAQIQRTAFANYLLDHVHIVRAVLPPRTDLNRYFEVMNTRGQQLLQEDIVKARLMAALPATEQPCFAWIWDACATMNGYVQMALTPKDTAKREALFGSDWSWLQVHDFATLCTYTASTSHSHGNTAAQGTPGEKGGLEQALLAYAQAPMAADSLEGSNERFQSTLRFPVFLLHALKLFKHLPSNAKTNSALPSQNFADHDTQLDDKQLIARFQASLGKHLSGPEQAQWVRDFAVHLLRLRNLLDAYVLKRDFKQSSSDSENLGAWSLKYLRRSRSNPSNVYYAPIGQLQSPTHDLSEEDTAETGISLELLQLQSMLRVTYTAPRGMHWITSTLQYVLSGMASQSAVHRHSEDQPDTHSSPPAAPAKLVQYLQTWAREHVRTALYPLEQSSPPTGFAIPRIVFTYLDYLLLQTYAKDTRNNLEDHLRDERNYAQSYRFGFRNSIEHFYPQTPPEDAQTAQAVDAAHLHLLGNLALVQVSTNSKFSNNSPLAKATQFSDILIDQSPKLRLMAQHTKTNNRWNNNDVRQHHHAMLALLHADLDLPSPTKGTYTGNPPQIQRPEK